MKYHILKELSDKNLQSFLSFCEEEGPKTLLIDSDGGISNIGEIVAHVCNTQHIPVVVYGLCHSASFELLFHLNEKPKVLPYAYSAVHLTTWPIQTRELLDKKSPSAFYRLETKRAHAEQREFYSSILSPKEVKRLFKGEEIYIDSERLTKILDKYYTKHE